MREMGARPMLAYRSNTIAKMLCEVRNLSETDHTRDLHMHTVHTHTHTRTRAC